MEGRVREAVLEGRAVGRTAVDPAAMAAKRLLFLCSWSLLLSWAWGSRFDPSTAPALGSPPDKVLSAKELISLRGYTPQVYQAVTEDGYVLGLTRIPRPGPPVLLINGMAISSEMWVLHGPGHDLGFILADYGYDVWLGEQRGLIGSDKHIKYNISQPEYWDFSHDESGYFDLPAMIDLILKESGQERLFYVGASLGGTLFMVMCDERPDYCAKVAGNVQFAPAMYISPAKQLNPITMFTLDVIKGSMDLWGEIGVYHMMMRPPLYREAMLHFCNLPVGRDVCFMLLSMITGFNKANMEPGWLGYSLVYGASGTSLRQLQHLVQLTSSGGTRKYDWGPIENMKKYNSLTPPSYDLTKITSPTAVYYSKKDRLLPYPAMKKTISLIGNLTYARTGPDSTYGHAEFIFGKDLYKLYYPDVLDFFDSISGMGRENELNFS